MNIENTIQNNDVEMHMEMKFLVNNGKMIGPSSQI